MDICPSVLKLMALFFHPFEVVFATASPLSADAHEVCQPRRGLVSTCPIEFEVLLLESPGVLLKVSSGLRTGQDYNSDPPMIRDMDLCSEHVLYSQEGMYPIMLGQRIIHAQVASQTPRAVHRMQEAQTPGDHVRYSNIRGFSSSEP